MTQLAKIYAFLALACFGLASAPVAHGEDAPREYQLKAAFVFNFAKFAEWPAPAFTNATAPIVIGVLGDNPFGSDLEQTIQNKTINERRLVVKTAVSLTEATNCHILFISTKDKKQMAEAFEALRGSSVLTVGEAEGFIEAGGMINFVVEDKKIRFQINNEAARSARLQISSKLLGLAVRPAR